MAHINVGNTVRDNNPTWPNYNDTGVVTSVDGNAINIEGFNQSNSWNVLSSSSQAMSDSVSNSNLGNGQSSFVFAWNDGYAEIARGIYYGG